MILRLILGIVLGGAAGFAWYKLVGCATGACPITSNPVLSTLYGAAVGGLLASSLR